jgi:hypothetical protein
VDTCRAQFGVESVCRVIDFAVSTYYATKKRATSPSARRRQDAQLIPLIHAAWGSDEIIFSDH